MEATKAANLLWSGYQIYGAISPLASGLPSMLNEIHQVIQFSGGLIVWCHLVRGVAFARQVFKRKDCKASTAKSFRKEMVP